jgi:hypothetical protein
MHTIVENIEEDPSNLPSFPMMQITSDYDVFMHKSYYDVMEWIRKVDLESDGKEKINVTVYQINANRKFVKFIKSPHFLYLSLQTEDPEICAKLAEINATFPSDGDRRHATASYFIECIQNTENTHKLFVNGVIYHR